MKIICTALLLVCCLTVSAQTWSEWFRQKKTQLRYLTQQIAALRVYTGYVQEGYHIADKGLTMIGDIKNGEFHLYRDFFGSLKTVPPRLQAYARSGDVIRLQQTMRQLYETTMTAANQSAQLRADETAYVRKVFLALLEQSHVLLEELVQLLTPDAYAFTDHERLQRIDTVHSALQDLVVRTHRFAASTRLLLRQRLHELTDIQKSRALRGF